MDLQDIYQDTIRFVAWAHRRQKVPGSRMPYLVHLSNVCMEILVIMDNDNTMDKDMAIRCALLHDCIEDTRVGYQDIKDNFGKNVAEGVLALSKNKKLRKEGQLIDSIHRILKQPREIWMVKMADRITNLQKPPNFWPKDKIKDYHRESIMVYNKLKDGNKILADRLKTKIEEYRQYF